MNIHLNAGPFYWKQSSPQHRPYVGEYVVCEIRRSATNGPGNALFIRFSVDAVTHDLPQGLLRVKLSPSPSVEEAVKGSVRLDELYKDGYRS